MKLLKRIIIVTTFLFSFSANAAFITTNEAELDSIFSQASFGSMPIDIRIGSITEIVYPSLLDITTNTEISTIFSLHVGGLDVVNFYFVDSISACGGFILAGIVGCGETPGNDFVVESAYAAGSYGGELLAHELGHNLGLGHLNGNYLMNPSLNHQTTLTELEVAKIRLSPLVKNDGQRYWIDINPVLIVRELTQKIPEPSTLLLLFLAMMLLMRNAKKTI